MSAAVLDLYTLGLCYCKSAVCCAMEPLEDSKISPPATPILACTDGKQADDSRLFGGHFELCRDSAGRPVEFGRGVWSIVYKATAAGAGAGAGAATVASAEASPITPPGSPLSLSPLSPRKVLAVKTPLRRDAHAVLDAEAVTLTRLSQAPAHEAYVVAFHGYLPESHSLVMAAVPLTLASFIEDRARLARDHLSTQSMLDPVMGMRPWLSLARHLIAGVVWMHDVARTVHGDIKPHNVVLRPRAGAGGDSPLTDPPLHSGSGDSAFPYEPLFVDFSSSHELVETAATEPPSRPAQFPRLSALTPPFTAPELLSVAALKSPTVAPTPASDVFSLAVTLLAAATGDLLVYPGSNSMQRLAMARQGHRVVDFARSSPAGGSRLPRDGAVQRLIEPAVLREPAQRIAPHEWLASCLTLF